MTRDGFVFLAMGFTGEKAAKFKEDYIDAFNKMEQAIKNMQLDFSNPETVLKLAQNGPLAGDTAQRIANEYGISRSTVKRAEKFAKVVDLLPEEARKSILDGSESIKQKESEAILKMDKPTQKKFLKEKNGITFLTILAAENSAVKYLLIFARL